MRATLRTKFPLFKLLLGQVTVKQKNLPRGVEFGEILDLFLAATGQTNGIL